ncbi:Sulfite exporter TauE/SafE [Maioricimonas rarisocia]|uniref:Probable membrane transporter protein n=1 Tax=Maioricimonas rarisocia TaxID=2528026 RepID=A0A517ZDS4_9PLAN|nr:sulfite exporter TauE/SafE family protein [Maioricimonas rarisocia]QDU40618.1 Sulfite exporter TauE/SafE [Maioricimonas rarisocia]
MISQSDPQQTLLFWSVFGIAVTVSATVQRLLGFGFALVALSVLPYVMDVRDANVIISLAAVPTLMLIFRSHRHGVHRRALQVVLLGALCGLVPGLFLFSAVDSSWLTRGTGAVVLLITVDMLRGRLPDPQREPSLAWGAFSGTVSGILAGAVGIPGPPVVAYGARQPWSPAEFRAFTAGFFLCLGMVKAIALAGTGFIDTPVLTATALSLPFVVVGYWLGAVVAARIDATRFRQSVLIALAISAACMLIRG